MHTVSFGREVASVILKIVAILVTLILIISLLSMFTYSFTAVSDGECNIAIMPIDGVILPYGYGAQYTEFATTPRDVRDFIAAVEADPYIDGVVFEINSPGGTPVASEMIAADIALLGLPNVALVGDMAASGGYLVAAAADTLYASPMSDVGSIGVTMSYLEESVKNTEEGITYVPLNAGKFKDTGSPYKPLSDEERTLLQGQLDEVHNYFIDLVSRYRNIDRAAVVSLADGSTMTGRQAVASKLADRLGGRAEVQQYFAVTLDKELSDISFCEYAPLPLL